MSKLLSYKYTGTKGHIADVASSLPKNPDDLLSNGWTEITDPRAKTSSNSRVFKEKSTGLRIRFDKGMNLSILLDTFCSNKLKRQSSSFDSIACA